MAMSQSIGIRLAAPAVVELPLLSPPASFCLALACLALEPFFASASAKCKPFLQVRNSTQTQAHDQSAIWIDRGLAICKSRVAPRIRVLTTPAGLDIV